MRTDYKAAKKLGDEAVREAVKNGTSPYLPVLDALEEVKQSAGQTRLGLMELPISRIKGNKEVARNNAFANNFMPIFEENSEFSYKWSLLYDSYKQEGIRDAIKVYEYMNQYYVQEGNKRVSVSKFGGTEFILADVTRIYPQKNDSKEVRAYYEYVDFYKVTKNFLILFSEPGAYAKLAELLGQDLENEWPEDVRTELKSAFFRFSKIYKNVIKIKDEYTISNAFLMYISIFPFKTIADSTDDQIAANIKMAHNEMTAGGNLDDVTFLNEAATEADKPTGIMSLFSKSKKYTSAAPLRVGFIYDADIENSRWIDSHEAGRLYVDEMMDDNVVTKAYYSETAGGVEKAIEQAVKDKNEIIFAVSPDMLNETLKAAVHNPNVKFLNCSVGNTYPSVRCYHGKLFEASFLMGIVTADSMLLGGGGKGMKIGYLARSGDSISYRNLNAFAIGVSMIDPEARISLKVYDEENETDFRNEWKNEGVEVYADIEYVPGSRNAGRAGVFRINGDKDEYIGVPFFNWGKYYVQIVQSVLVGTWNISELANNSRAANYWFGLSTGVVDIRTPGVSYPTSKMISFFKNAIIGGGLDPFSGEIHTQNGEVIQKAKKGTSSITLDKMSAGNIISMKWLNENIEGAL